MGSPGKTVSMELRLASSPSIIMKVGKYSSSHIEGGFVKEKTHMTRTRQCRGWRGAMIQKTLDEHSTFVVRDLATCDLDLQEWAASIRQDRTYHKLC